MCLCLYYARIQLFSFPLENIIYNEGDLTPLHVPTVLVISSRLNSTTSDRVGPAEMANSFFTVAGVSLLRKLIKPEISNSFPLQPE